MIRAIPFGPRIDEAIVDFDLEVFEREVLFGG